MSVLFVYNVDLVKKKHTSQIINSKCCFQTSLRGAGADFVILRIATRQSSLNIEWLLIKNIAKIIPLLLDCRVAMILSAMLTFSSSQRRSERPIALKILPRGIVLNIAAKRHTPHGQCSAKDFCTIPPILCTQKKL